ncbi:MAG: GatB/YqeY domain-containing protein [Bacteroidetes bacterium]|nr:GatB/YqeY domain-containing protein [Bacteroidota bacterium]MDA0888843.1 GatB/YqeY domain-containing protein [Bacteroidota bacterium]MDA1084606.1 GatB/YqeY domain-containing protein [Bacteroidota bacterium]
MSLQEQVTQQLKTAMKAKDSVALESLRAIKSAILLTQTQAGAKDLTADDEIKLVQKLVKQRKDSAEIFREQGRLDLAEPEEAQIKIIEQFLPEQLDEAAIAEIIEGIIAQTNADGMKDMGKVMGMATKAMAGKADGKTISAIVRQKLA